MKTALLKLHIALVLAGFTAILAKLISLGEASLLWWRLFLTVLVLGIYFIVSKRKIAYSKSLIVKVMGVGAIVGLHWLCFFGSVKWGNVSIALVCFSLAGFFSALLEPLLLKKKMSWMEVFLGSISVVGVYIIFHFDARYKLGIALGVACAALSSLFSIFNKKLVPQIDKIAMTAFEMFGALIMLSIITPFYVFGANASFLPMPLDWLWLGILSVLCTVWAFALQLGALKYISAFTLNLSYNLEPVYGIILAFLIFNENKHLNASFYIGVGLILSAVLLQMWLLRRTHKKELSVFV
jgi:drug/metabolite transporter (DMT)-like permease